jgi:ubiquinone/menaquinone biosynthesis C-methylase UbiE
MKSSCDYNGLAWVYNKHWGPRFAQRVLLALGKLLLERLPAKSAILDLCCGTENVARALTDRASRLSALTALRK